MFASVHGQQLGSVNICEGVANYIFLTDITNCTNYYICVNEQPILQHCENKTFFNGATQSCDTSSAACLDCTKNQNQLSFAPLSKTCNKYVMCFAGEPILRQCADNLQYNSTTKECNIPSKVDCVDNKCGIQNNPSDVIYLPSQSYCDKYYICLSGTPVPQFCAAGLQFSTACNCCDLKSKVGCDIKPLSRSAQHEKHTSPQLTSNLSCPEAGTFFYPHVNPQQYYVCSNGKGAVLTCAEGLFYDSKAQECRQLKNILLN